GAGRCWRRLTPKTAEFFFQTVEAGQQLIDLVLGLTPFEKQPAHRAQSDQRKEVSHALLPWVWPRFSFITGWKVSKISSELTFDIRPFASERTPTQFSKQNKTSAIERTLSRHC